MLLGSSLSVNVVSCVGVSDVDIPGSVNCQAEQGRPQCVHCRHQLICLRVEDEEVLIWNFWLFYHIHCKPHRIEGAGQLPCIESNQLPIQILRLSARELGLVIGLKGDDVEPSTTDFYRPRFLGRNLKVADDLTGSHIYNRNSIGRRERYIGFGVIRESDSHWLIKPGRFPVQVDILDGRNDRKIGWTVRIIVDDAHRI